MNWSYRLAFVISIAALGVALIPGFISRSVQFAPDLALTVITVMVLAWTAAAATENLRELRKARVAEVTPIIDVIPPEQIYPTQHKNIEITLRNLGRGAASRIRTRIWRREGPSIDRWFATAVYDPSSVIEPGGTLQMTLPVTHNDLWGDQIGAKIADLGETGPDFVIEVTFVDPLANEHRVRVAFVEVADDETHETIVMRVDDGDLPNLEVIDRRALLQSMLEEFVELWDGPIPEWDIPENTKSFQLNLHLAGGTISVFRSVDKPVAEVAIEMQQAFIKHASEEGGSSA